MRQLADFEPLFTQLMHLMARNTRFRSDPILGDILNENPRLVVVFNHSTPLSWLPASCLLAIHYCARGGGERRAVGVMDRVFYSVPFLKTLAKFFTQSEKSLCFDELVNRLVSTKQMDLVIFPEGSNCFFGRPDEIQEFRSPKFIELAVRAQIPILVCVHRGSEHWATNVRFAIEWLEALSGLRLLPKKIFSFLEKRIRKTELLTVPLLPAPMDRFEMRCELYYPELRLVDLAQDVRERSQQLAKEAQLIRSRMQTIFCELAPSHVSVLQDVRAAQEISRMKRRESEITASVS